MDTQTINTPEKLYQAIGEFLQSEYSHENLVETYNDALKCATRFRVDYSALPALPVHKDKPLYGLQDVMDWCIKASKVVDDIVVNLEQQTISKVISQLKELRDFANRVLSLVDSKLREQAQKEARAVVEKERKNLEEKYKESRLKLNGMPLILQAKIASELELDTLMTRTQEVKEAVQIYLSKDPNFKDNLSKLHDEEINKAFEALNKLVGSDTSTGKLLDIYCKLKDIPLQRQFNDVGYAYFLNDYTDMICGGCNRLYTGIDTVIKTFEEIQTKAEQNTNTTSKTPRKSTTSERKFQPWTKSGDACFIVENNRIKFHYKDKEKDLRLKNDSRTHKLIFLFAAKNPLPTTEIQEICTKGTRPSDIVKYANAMLNEKMAALNFTDVPSDIEFIKYNKERNSYGLWPKVQQKEVFDSHENTC